MQGCRAFTCWRLYLPPVGHLSSFCQHTIKSRFRGNIAAQINKDRYNLIRCQMSELLRIGHIQDTLPFQ